MLEILALLNKMASAPQQTPTHSTKPQQSSSPSASEPSSTQPQRESSVPPSAASETSSISLLNHPSSAESSRKPSPSPETQKQQQLARPKPQTVPSSAEPKKCWICLQNETEDTPTSSQWRSPCACKLQAHETCLLDWVAEVERPRPGNPGKPKVECPQCKTSIHVVRPRSFVLEFLRRAQRIQARLTLPFTAVALLGGITYGCYIHGLNTVYVMFGTKDAERLLGSGQATGRLYNNLEFLLPFIPVTLLASRTHYADSLLPALPIFYFTVNQPTRHAGLWPPSATMTLIALPYIRAAYNETLKYLFAEKEKAWIKEIQPRGGEGADQGEQQAEDQPAGDGEGMNIELGIQLEVVEEDEARPDEAHPPAQPAAEPPADGQANAQNNGRNGPQQPAAPAANPQPQPVNAANAANAIPIIINVVLEKAIGALIFPTIASSMGMALDLLLPRKWVVPPGRWENYPVGFLQSRFGRSVVGGCLFVVLKDSLLLYSKYRMAQVHKQRRVMDYDVAKRKIKK